MKRAKSVKVGDQECLVETLTEWLDYRIASIEHTLENHEPDHLMGDVIIETLEGRICSRCKELGGRLAELFIILEKVKDGRIQEIK